MLSLALSLSLLWPHSAPEGAASSRATNGPFVPRVCESSIGNTRLGCFYYCLWLGWQTVSRGLSNSMGGGGGRERGAPQHAAPNTTACHHSKRRRESGAHHHGGINGGRTTKALLWGGDGAAKKGEDEALRWPPSGEGGYRQFNFSSGRAGGGDGATGRATQQSLARQKSGVPTADMSSGGACQRGDEGGGGEGGGARRQRGGGGGGRGASSRKDYSGRQAELRGGGSG